MKELSEYVKSEPQEVLRSSIRLAGYNPRRITDGAKKSLKRGIKKFGLLGGVVVNRRTGMTVVSGHQRIAVMDDLNRYPDEDYMLRVDVIDVGDKEEKELNILLNNPNAQGMWDYDALREIIPDIDYKDAGLTEEDLSLIGVDFLLQTDEQSNLANELSGLMSGVNAQNEVDKDTRKARVMEEKQKIRKAAEEKANDMDAYVTLSFDSCAAKSSFMKRFGYNPADKFLKGEVFSNQIERVD
jgi:DNA-binding Lrp family transcriptional regulator